MKKLILPALLLINVVYSYSSTMLHLKNVSVPEIENQSILPVPDTTSYHTLSYDSVCILISNFLSRPGLFNEATQHGLGGFISTKAIKKEAEKKTTVKTEGLMPAIRFFPCYQDSSGTIKVFAAFDKNGGVNPADSDLCTVGKGVNLPISSDPFVYDKGKSDIDSVSNFLSTQITQISNGEDSLVSDSVIAFSKTFLTQYSDTSERPGGCICGAAYETEVNSLLDQKDDEGKSVIGLRFFFGYDDSGKYKNKIRLILIAVKQNGENLLNVNGKEAMFKEKVWPININ